MCGAELGNGNRWDLGEIRLDLLVGIGIGGLWGSWDGVGKESGDWGWFQIKMGKTISNVEGFGATDGVGVDCRWLSWAFKTP